MPNSSRMNWPYPAENQNLWYEAFTFMIESLDASGFAAREDRSIMLMGGGTITWQATGSQLVWSQPMRIVSPISGFLLSLPAATVTLAEGQFLYATLVRAPTRTQNLVPTVGNQVPSTDTDILLAVRVGDDLYFRTGLRLLDGETSDGVSPGAGGGGGGGAVSVKFGPYTYTQAPVPVLEVIAQFTFDGGTAGSADVYFAGVLTPALSGPGSTEVRLYDLGPSGGPYPIPRLVSTLSSATSGLTDLSKVLTVVTSAPGVDQIWDTKRVYELAVYQASVSGDTAYIGSAGLEVV